MRTNAACVTDRKGGRDRVYQNLFSIMPSIQRRHPIAFGLQKVTSLSYCNIGLLKNKDMHFFLTLEHSKATEL